MISFFRRLLTRQPSELEQMRRNRDYWREAAIAATEREQQDCSAAKHGEPECDAKSGGFLCTRMANHEGDHAAHGSGNRPLHVWPR